MADMMTLASAAKWLRKAAEEIRDEGHPGWGNTCEFAADAIDAAIKQRDQDAKDAARLEWYFGPSDKKDWLDTYMRGMREGWSVGQWRAAIDAAMVESKSNE